LPDILARGAEAYGFHGTRWTRARIRQVIEDLLGVSYHVDHMSYLMDNIGWTQQKPREVATQQSQAAVEAWQANWPAVEKSQAIRANNLLFYAPELNPQEGIWRYLKYVELANLCCHDLDELRLELRRAIQRVRYRLDVIVGCLAHVNCSVSESITV
jgi:hypothetical protein